mmetsp:Transcript_675/g.917  ORF Transcript_675/g.917 Transcript_675/m.917 type:complete len:609 (-) Transcript_675:191-2017(-)
MDEKAKAVGDGRMIVHGKREKVNGKALVNGKSHSNRNGVNGDKKVRSYGEGDLLHTESGFKVSRAELIRILVQSMKDLGCKRSAESLEKESGVSMEKDSVQEFRDGVENGDWKKVKALLTEMELSKDDRIKAMILIHEEQFLELLEDGKTSEALKILRGEISPHLDDRSRLNSLSSLVMFPTATSMRTAANWPGVKAGSRLKLLNKLQKFLDPSCVVPESRLMTLIDQALRIQIFNCPFHNSKVKTLSLLHDCRCSLGEIPSVCAQTLDDHKDEVWAVSFSNDGLKLASASKDRTIILWDMHSCPEKSPSIIHRLKGHKKPPSFVSWSKTDDLLLSSDNSSSFKVWETKTGILKLAIPSTEKLNSADPDTIMACAWHPDGKHVISGSLTDNKISTWDLTGSCVHVWELQHAMRDMCISSARQSLVLVGTDQSIRTYDCATRTRKKCSIKETSPITSFCLSRDGRYALLSLANPAAIRLWDLVTGEVVHQYDGVKQSRYVVQASFGGSEEMFVVSGSEDSQVYIWHRTSADLLAVLPGHSGTVNCVAWSQNSPHMFVSASDDNTIKVWGRATSIKAKETERVQSCKAHETKQNGFGKKIQKNTDMKRSD